MPALLVRDGRARHGRRVWHRAGELEYNADCPEAPEGRPETLQLLTDSPEAVWRSVVTRCGRTLNVREHGLDQADFAPDLCRRCWPPIIVPTQKQILGHYVEAPMDLEFGRQVRFGLSVLNLADGVRMTYEGTMALDLGRMDPRVRHDVTKIPLLARRIRITTVTTEVRSKSLDPGPVYRLATKKTTLAYITRRVYVSGMERQGDAGGTPFSEQQIRSLMGEETTAPVARGRPAHGETQYQVIAEVCRPLRSTSARVRAIQTNGMIKEALSGDRNRVDYSASQAYRLLRAAIAKTDLTPCKQ